MKAIRRIVVVAALLMPAFSACAWNETGHRAIALVAYDQLTPKARAAVAEILAAHPHAATLLRENVEAEDSKLQASIFANSAKWPDDVRSAPYSATFHHGTWHYLNIAYVPPQYAKSIKAKSLPEAGDILKAIAENMAVLKQAGATNEQKAVAICWIAHLVGDIHQPLHAVALYTPELPKGDKGGNFLLVRQTAEAKSVSNLHSIWDHMLGAGSSMEAAENAASRIRSEYPAGTKLPNLKRHTSPRSWAEESLDVAKSAAYLNGKLSFVIDKKGEKPIVADVPALPDGYLVNGRQVADLRAAQAANRLAALLNDCLGK